MSATGQPDGQQKIKEFTSISSADTTTFVGASSMADWVQIIGAGSTVLKDEGGNSLTLTTDADEPFLVMSGPFTAFTSTSATRVRMGQGKAPSLAVPASAVPATATGYGGVKLAGGLGGTGSVASAPVLSLASGNVTGILPGISYQSYVNDPTVHTSAFAPIPGYMHKIQPSGATFAYTFPAITSAMDGMRVAIVNITTGTTATVAAPTGSDNIGNNAGASTGVTAAGPTNGAVKVYVADNTQKAWLVGL